MSKIIKLISVSAVALLSFITLTATTAAATCTPTDAQLAAGIDYNTCDEGFTFPSFNHYRNYPLIPDNSGVTTFDERDFYRVRKNDDPEYINQITVVPGDVIEFYGYIHNDCAADLNNANDGDNDIADGPCVAQDTKVRLDGFLSDKPLDDNGRIIVETGPIAPNGRKIMNMNVSASNTRPLKVSDSVNIINGHDKSIKFTYVIGTAKIKSPVSNIFYYLDPLEVFTLNSNSGEFIDSVIRTADQVFFEGTFFGSIDYRQEIRYKVIVQEVPDTPNLTCSGLKLEVIAEVPEKREALISLTASPDIFQDQIMVGFSGVQPDDSLVNQRKNQVVVIGYYDGTTIEAKVPGFEGVCSAEYTFELDDDEPDTPERCISIDIEPETFVPGSGSTTFTATTNPADFAQIVWSVTPVDPNIEVEVSNRNRTATFTNLTSDSRVIAKARPGILKGSPNCKDTATPEEVPPPDVCKNLTLYPTRFDSGGNPTVFRISTVPTNYEGEFTWTGTSGTFTDTTAAPTESITTDAREVIYRGGQPNGVVNVFAADERFAGVCAAKAVATDKPLPPERERPRLTKSVKSTNSGRSGSSIIAQNGERITYTVIYKPGTLFIDTNEVKIFDTIGVEGRIRGTQGGEIVPANDPRGPNASTVIGIDPCRSEEDSNCFVGSILSPDGFTIRDYRSPQPITITYDAVVHSAITAESCQRLTARSGCGEDFVNVTYDTQNNRSTAKVTVLCPAFRSYGFGDILIEETFKGGFDTVTCNLPPNTEGIIVTPVTPPEEDREILKTGPGDVVLPDHGFCKNSDTVNNLSSKRCELAPQASQEVYSLQGVKKNVDLLTNNVEPVNATINANTDIARYYNPNNPSQKIAYFDKLTINGPLTISDRVTIIANETIINGNITYAAGTTSDGRLPGLVLATQKLTARNTTQLSGIYIGIPDDGGRIYEATFTNTDTELAGKPLTVLGSLLLNFEITNSDVNVIYDIIRVQDFAILSDIIDYLQESSV